MPIQIHFVKEYVGLGLQNFRYVLPHILSNIRKTFKVLKWLTPTLSGGLCVNQNPHNRFYVKLYRLIDCVFFLIVSILLKSFIEIKISKKNHSLPFIQCNKDLSKLKKNPYFKRAQNIMSVYSTRLWN